MNAAEARRVDLGWPEHHIIWIEAAMSLPRRERTAAYKDIAAMTARTLCAVRCKAWWLAERRENEMRRAKARAAALQLVAKQPLVVAGKLGVSNPVPSGIRPLSKARLMGARA